MTRVIYTESAAYKQAQLEIANHELAMFYSPNDKWRLEVFPSNGGFEFHVSSDEGHFYEGVTYKRLYNAVVQGFDAMKGASGSIFMLKGV